MDINNLKSALSNRLRELRQSLHYSIKKIGDCFNTTPISYRRYEQGKAVPGFLSLYFIASELGISLERNSWPRA